MAIDRRELCAIFNYFTIIIVLIGFDVAACRVGGGIVRWLDTNERSLPTDSPISKCDMPATVGSVIPFAGLSLSLLIWNKYFSESRTSLLERSMQDIKTFIAANVFLGPLSTFLVMYLWFDKKLSEAGVFFLYLMTGSMLLSGVIALTYKMMQCVDDRNNVQPLVQQSSSARYEHTPPPTPARSPAATPSPKDPLPPGMNPC